MIRYPRDMDGYGARPPCADWPGGALIAVQFVVNYEEGGESNIAHGDTGSEAFLSEIPGAQSWPGERHWNMESVYEYGARCGFWRLHRLFTGADIAVTVFGVASALARSPRQVAAMLEADWEIASHGLKWIDYRSFSQEQERQHMEQAIDLHRAVTGAPPAGWYTGRCSINTVDLAASLGRFEYVADSYCDDLPYWHRYRDGHQLVVPYTLDANDMRFATAEGFNSGDQFFTYLKDSFDVLYEEGKAGMPKMMSVGLHCRLAGRPGRLAAVKRFIEYASGHARVWFARRVDIARHWHQYHPVQQETKMRPSQMDKETFVDTFGGVFENSPFIAERAHDLEMGPAHDSAIGMHSLLCRVFRTASHQERLGVLRAHPDLAGRLAAARRLGRDSQAEQQSAGLDALSEAERKKFALLNGEYVKRHGFPFIIAVKGLDRQQILAAFQERISKDTDVEFETACAQVERIAFLRLADMLDQEGI